MKLQVNLIISIIFINFINARDITENKDFNIILSNEINNEATSTQSLNINHHNNNKRKLSNKKHQISNRNTNHVITTTTILKPAYDDSEYSIYTTNLNDQEQKHDSQQVQHTNVTVKVGDTAILTCVINSTQGSNPGVIWMQGKLGNVLTLNTNRITVDSRFDIIQQPLPELEIKNKIITNNKRDGQSNFIQQLPIEVGYYHLRIANVQLYDENEYACETSITKKNEDQPNLHSLVYLHITQSPSFIEALTSESNIAGLEFGDVILKCFAVGKPTPKIRWFQIEENSGLIRDLNHESTSLTIKNISRYDNNKYECVAGNGILPSVSKKFSVTVYYTPVLTPIRKKVFQNIGQTVLLGCVVNSNPESNVNWYKLNTKKNATHTDTNNHDFVLIDASQSKYQLHKFKQTNQTVSYLKIKNLETLDYTKYKCEGVNVVGKADALIELLDAIESEQHNHHKNKHRNRPSNKHNHIKVYNSVSDELNSFRAANRIDDYDQIEINEDSYNYDAYEQDINQNSSSYENDQLNKNHPRGESSNKHHSNMRKKNFPRKFHNKTSSSFKYQINKSSRVIESENSLQNFDDYASSEAIKSCAHFGYLLILIVSFAFLAQRRL